jgi:hypothetical protein
VRYRYTWECSAYNEINLKEILSVGVDFIHRAQDSVQWRVLFS